MVASAENIRAMEWMQSYARDLGVEQVKRFAEGFGNYFTPENPFGFDKSDPATKDNFTIGVTNDNNLQEHFKGAISELRIWNVARTVDQLRAAQFETLSGNAIPKLLAPRQRDWGEILRFLRLENLPGAYPYTGGLRFRVDMNQTKGNRVSNLEIRNSSGAWVALDPAASYKLITNNFTAEGGDKYDTFKTIPAAQREDTLLDYADSFLQYVRSKGALAKPAAAERSTQGYIETP